jgi:hypothetical protein
MCYASANELFCGSPCSAAILSGEAFGGDLHYYSLLYEELKAFGIPLEIGVPFGVGKNWYKSLC